MSFLQSLGEVLVELGVWGGEGLSAGDLACPTEAASSASGAGHGGQEAGDDAQGPGSRAQVVGEVGQLLDLQAWRLELEGASGPFPRSLLSALSSPAARHFSCCSVFFLLLMQKTSSTTKTIKRKPPPQMPVMR